MSTRVGFLELPDEDKKNISEQWLFAKISSSGSKKQENLHGQ